MVSFYNKTTICSVLFCILFGCFNGFSNESKDIKTTDLSALEKAHYLKKIKDFLKFDTFKAHFLQETAEGFQEGILYVKRPKSLRLDYHAPCPLVLITQDDWLKQYNKETREQEAEILIDETPAAFLLNIDQNFERTFSFKNWHQSPGLLTVDVSSSTLKALDITLTLVFELHPFALKQWIIKDAMDQETKVTLFNWDINHILNNSLFKKPN